RRVLFRSEQFYVAVGFEPIEQIVIYELHGLRPPRHRPLTPVFVQVDLDDPRQRRDLIDLDHSTFPWLWWNSEAEFENYAESNGVSIEMAYDDDGRPLAYV